MRTFLFRKLVRDKVSDQIRRYGGNASRYPEIIGGKPLGGIGTFQVGVGMMLVNDQHQVLVVKRSPKEAHAAGKWDVVSGRLEQGETFEEGLQREIVEELGSEVQVDIIEPYFTYHVNRDDGYEVQGVSFYCRDRGGEIKLNDEHTEYRWATVRDALKLISIEGVQSELKTLQRKYFK